MGGEEERKSNKLLWIKTNPPSDFTCIWILRTKIIDGYIKEKKLC